MTMVKSTTLIGVFAIFALVVIGPCQMGADPNYLIGWIYISYNNFNGTLATGQCCDEPNKTAGFCTPNMCDTAFEFCMTGEYSTSECDLMKRQNTPTTYNNNSFEFGTLVANKTSNNLVTKLMYTKQKIFLTFRALETERNASFGEEIANFNVTITWLDPIFNRTAKYRRFVLNDTHAQLVLDVVSMCNKYYYTSDCSVHCHKTTVSHFECLDNGTKECHPGWYGKNCDSKIDFCLHNDCKHGSSCVETVKSYTCVCLPGFTGIHCETNQTTLSTMVSMTTRSASSTSQGSSTINVKTNNGDGDDGTAGIAAGVSVGMICLLLILAAGAYFIYKRKQRGQVTPEEKQPSTQDKQVAESAKNDEPRKSISITVKASSLPHQGHNVTGYTTWNRTPTSYKYMGVHFEGHLMRRRKLSTNILETSRVSQTVGDIQQNQSSLPDAHNLPVDTGITQ